MEEVVNLVVGVEQLSDRSVDVSCARISQLPLKANNDAELTLRLEGSTSLGPAELEVEGEVGASRGAVTVHAVATVRVVLRDDVVTASVEVDGVLAALELAWNSVPAGGRSCDKSGVSDWRDLL